MIGASAARVVVDTVAVVDVDDLDRSLPSIACVIFCKAEEKVSSRLVFVILCGRRPSEEEKKRYTFFHSLSARENERETAHQISLFLRARVCVSSLSFACVFIIIERRECRAEEAKMLRT